ncbi:MAG: DeoR/GlpR family DNA-binding transcription regulator [Bacteroidota bacterium]
MNYQERKRVILKLLDERGSIHAKELMESLNASEITVRRDLSEMAKKGLLFRTHGGAMRTELAKDPEPVSFKGKSTQNLDKKTYICEIASKFIKDGDVIYLDCGSTVFQICQFIKNKKIKVITNSLPILYELLGTGVSISLIGGEVDHERQAAHGKTATDQIGRYQASKAFISTDGISIGNGLSSKSEIESETALSMTKNAKEVFLLIDSSKLERDSFLKFAPISIIHSLVTDKIAKDEILEKYHKLGIKIYK